MVSTNKPRWRLFKVHQYNTDIHKNLKWIPARVSRMACSCLHLFPATSLLPSISSVPTTHPTPSFGAHDITPRDPPWRLYPSEVLPTPHLSLQFMKYTTMCLFSYHLPSWPDCKLLKDRDPFCLVHNGILSASHRAQHVGDMHKLLDPFMNKWINKWMVAPLT